MVHLPLASQCVAMAGDVSEQRPLLLALSVITPRHLRPLPDALPALVVQPLPNLLLIPLVVQGQEAVEDFATGWVTEGVAQALLRLVEAVAQVQVGPALGRRHRLVHLDVQPPQPRCPPPARPGRGSGCTSSSAFPTAPASPAADARGTPRRTTPDCSGHGEGDGLEAVGGGVAEVALH